MATVTKPIALDESLHTTETSPRNLADVLDDGLAAIANSYNVTGILPVSNGGTGANNATDAKANIGLGNVPNVTTDNQTPTVTQDSTRTNLATGDTLKTIVGKIKKWFADLGDLAFLNKDGASSTKFLRGDGTWQTVASGVTGVKGNSESSYRTGDVNLTKANIGLGNVDNTSDASKPVSTATQTALDGKVPNTRTVNGHALSSDVSVTASDVGLGNVNNTSDLNKPISTATQTALNGKANTSALTDGSVTKIGTATVGSSTQPVYINGGVPTAMTGALAAVNGGTGDIYGKAPFVYVGKVTDADIPVQGSAEVNRRTIVSLIKGNANNHAPTPNNWYILYTSSGSDTGADYGSQIAVGVNVETIWYRIKHGGTWREWNQIYGITTGTPTNIHANLTLNSGYSFVQKSGNVVRFRVSAKTTAGTLGTYTTLCKLPFAPIAQEWGTLDYGVLGSAFNHANWYMDTSGNINLGHGITLSANQDIYITGTYMTND